MAAGELSDGDADDISLLASSLGDLGASATLIVVESVDSGFDFVCSTSMELRAADLVLAVADFTSSCFVCAAAFEGG